MARRKKVEITEEQEVPSIDDAEVEVASADIYELPDEEPVPEPKVKLSLEDRYKELGLCPKQASVYLYKEYAFAEVNAFLKTEIYKYKKAKLKGCC